MFGLYSLGMTHQQLVVMRTNKPRELIKRAETFHWWKSLLRYFSILKACLLFHRFNSMYAWDQLHIVIRHHFIRELVECSIVTLKQCLLNNQLAGLFTKSLDIRGLKLFEDPLAWFVLIVVYVWLWVAWWAKLYLYINIFESYSLEK